MNLIDWANFFFGLPIDSKELIAARRYRPRPYPASNSLCSFDLAKVQLPTASNNVIHNMSSAELEEAAKKIYDRYTDTKTGSHLNPPPRGVKAINLCHRQP
ncbi:MAG: hypothetical protein FWF24_04145 [Alphaproteobacteria bacterium]|nr:hypothetical protein [Alphaproteobacteria bacterium]